MRTLFDRLEKLSSAPIIFKNPINSIYSNLLGLCRYRENDILISPYIDSDLQLFVSAHEVGHMMCYKSNCKCRNIGSILQEFHANIFALKFLLKHHQFSALSHGMFELTDVATIRGQVISYPHYFSAYWLLKTKLWKHCETILNQNLI